MGDTGREPRVAPAGPHGGDGPAVAEALGLDPADVLDLSQSLNPVAPDVGAVVLRRVDALGRYPDASRATAALADALGVDASRVLLTNGGAEAIALVATAVGGWCDEPEFSLHPRGARGDGPRWRSNPNNPTGLLAAPADVAGVWDEAFWPLAAGTWTRGDALAGDAVVVGSLTKAFACPGLRLGYVIAPDDALVASLRRRQPSWSVSWLACAVLPELLIGADPASWTAAVAALRVQLVDVLTAAGLEPRPSDANWVLVDAPGLRGRLACEGVVVRDCASFGMPGVHRVAVPDPRGLERLDRALRRCVA